MPETAPWYQNPESIRGDIADTIELMVDDPCLVDELAEIEALEREIYQVK